MPKIFSFPLDSAHVNDCNKILLLWQLILLHSSTACFQYASDTKGAFVWDIPN